MLDLSLIILFILSKLHLGVIGLIANDSFGVETNGTTQKSIKCMYGHPAYLNIEDFNSGIAFLASPNVVNETVC